jgi:hypothetical protein
MTATNSAGSGSAVVTLSVAPGTPVLSYSGATGTSGSVGTLMSVAPTSIDERGASVTSCTATPALPTWANIDQSTCAISGIPTSVLASTNYTITASNSAGSGSTVVTLVVIPNSPIISYSGSSGTSVALGTEMTITPSTLINQGAAISNCVPSPALPSGLNIDDTTCVISGISSSALPSTPYTIEATNSAGTGTAIVTLFVNDAPAVADAGDTTLNVVENATATNFTLGSYTDSDSHQSALSYVTVTAPTKGIVSTLPSTVPASGTSSITYTPSADLTGSDSFSYKVCDAAGVTQACSSVVTVNVNINKFNNPPAVVTAGPTTASATEDTAATITLGSYTDSDNMQASLHYVAVTQPTKGTVGPLPGTVPATGTTTVSYTPTANANGSDTFSYKVCDGASGVEACSEVATVSISIDPTSDAPTMAAIAAQVTDEDTPKTVAFSPGDVDGALACTDTYLMYASSNSAVVDDSNAVVWSGTWPNCTGTISPAPNASGSTDITFIVSDGATTASRQFLLSIAAVNDAPTIGAIGSQSTFFETASSPISFLISDIDGPAGTCNGDYLSYSSATNSVVPEAGAVNWGGSWPNCTAVITPATGASGLSLMTIVASDGAASSSPQAFTLSINALSPTISYVGASGTSIVLNTAASITPTTLNGRGASVTSCTSSPALPAWANINESTCVISGTPTATLSSTSYTISAANSVGTGTATVTLAVTAARPSLSYSGVLNNIVSYGSLLTIVPSTLQENGADITGCAVKVPTTPLPNWASINELTCTISGTPDATQAETTYTIVATNSAGTSDDATVKITVNANTPVVSYAASSGTTGAVNTAMSITPSTLNDRGSNVTSCTASPDLPTWASISPTTCVISGTPTATLSPTTYTITAANLLGTGMTSVTLAVNTGAPLLSYAGATGTTGSVGDPMNVSPTSVNDGGSAITSCTSSPALPVGTSINNLTCVISGVPTTPTASAAYTITATNAVGQRTATVTLAVIPGTPIISYSGATGTSGVVNTALSITPTALTNRGADITKCTSSPALPAWANINELTCVISGTPNTTLATTTYTISATNTAGTGTATVNITVTTGPPILSYVGASGTTASLNSATTVTPTTLNNQGMAITACTSSPDLPAWATLNATTCAITGTPTALLSPRTYTITATNAAGTGTANVTLSVIPSPLVTMTHAVQTTGSLSVSAEKDYFAFTAAAGGTISFTLNFPSCGASSTCWKASLLDIDGNALAIQISPNGVSSFILRNSIITGGTYYVMVEKNTTYSASSYTITPSFSSGTYSAETELNGSRPTATILANNITVTGQIMTPTDLDYYSLSASEEGTIAFDFWFPNRSATAWKASLFDSNGNLLAQRSSIANTATTVTLKSGVPAAGTYYLLIEPVGHSYYDYTVKGTFTAGTSTWETELNDSLTSASALTDNVTFTGQLVVATDLDYYSLTASGAGTIAFDFSFPSCGNTTCWKASILDSNGNLLAQRFSTTNAASTFTLRNGVTAAATYYVLVQINTSHSLHDYTVKGTFTAGTPTSETESNGTRATASVLTDNVTVTSQLMSATDLDYYSLTASGVGTIAFDFAFPNCTACWKASLLDSNGNLLAQKISFTTATTTFTLKYGVTEAGTYHVLVEKNTNYSQLDYTVKGTFTAGPSTTESEANESRLSASTINDTVTLTGQLMSATDLDYYSLTTSGAGTVAFDFSFPDCDSVCWKTSLYDASGNLLAQRISASNAISTFTLQNSSGAASTYYVLVEKATTYSHHDYSVKGTFKVGLFTAESELNDTRPTATTLSTNLGISGQLMNVADLDYYSFTAPSAGTFAVDVSFPSVATNIYFKASLLTSGGSTLETRTSTAGSATTVTLQNSVLSAGTYYVLVQVNTTFYSDLDYTVKLRPFVAAVIAESETNETRGTATAISANTTVSGWLASTNDVDYYAFSVSTAGVVAYDFSFPDCNSVCWKASLYDVNGILLAQQTSSNNAISTFSLENYVPAAGTYYAAIEKSTTYSGLNYTLKARPLAGGVLAESEANETAATATALTNNATATGQLMSATDIDYYSVTINGAGTVAFNFTVPSCGTSVFCWTASLRDSAGNILVLRKPTGATTVTLQNIVQSAGTYYLSVEKSTTYSSLNYSVKSTVNGNMPSIESEPNSSRPTATVLTPRLTTTGQIYDATDKDYYSVATTAAGTVAFDASFPNCGAYNCWKATLLDSNGTTIVQKTSTASAATTVTLTTLAASAATYYLLVETNTTWHDSNYTVQANVRAWSGLGTAEAFTTLGGVNTINSPAIAPLQLSAFNLLSVLNESVFRDRALTTNSNFYITGSIGTTWTFSWKLPTIDTVYIRAQRHSGTNVTWSVSGDISGGAYSTSFTSTEYSFSTSATTGSATITIGNANNGFIIQDIAFYSGGSVVPVTWLSSPGDSEIEANDTTAEATPVLSGLPYTGALSISTDKDYFAITAESAGSISVDLVILDCGSTSHCWRASIYDGSNTLLASQSGGFNGIDIAGLSTTATAAGTYYVVVEKDATYNTIAAQPYLLTTRFSPGDTTSESEVNNSAAQATPISSGTGITGQLMSATDKDYFAMTAASAGSISVDLVIPDCGNVPNCWRVSIYDGSNALLASQSGGYNGLDIVGLTTTAAAAGTYYVLVEKDIVYNYLTAQPYLLTTHFAPGDTTSESENNDSAAQATPISNATDYTGQLSSATDKDYFAMTAASAGSISVDLVIPDCGSTPNCWRVSIYDGSNTLLASQSGGYTASGIVGLTTTAAAAGTYYVLVEKDIVYNYLTDKPYLLTTHFAPGDTTSESENNDSAAQANPISSHVDYTGQLSSATDKDYFALTVASAGSISVNLIVPNCGSAANCWKASIYDSSNTVLATQAAGYYGGDITNLTATAAAAGNYYIVIEKSTLYNYVTEQFYLLTTRFTPGVP